jgi:hypothetical protein
MPINKRLGPAVERKLRAMPHQLSSGAIVPVRQWETINGQSLAYRRRRAGHIGSSGGSRDARFAICTSAASPSAIKRWRTHAHARWPIRGLGGQPSAAMRGWLLTATISIITLVSDQVTAQRIWDCQRISSSSPTGRSLRCTMAATSTTDRRSISCWTHRSVRSPDLGRRRRPPQARPRQRRAHPREHVGAGAAEVHRQSHRRSGLREGRALTKTLRCIDVLESVARSLFSAGTRLQPDRYPRLDTTKGTA